MEIFVPIVPVPNANALHLEVVYDKRDGYYTHVSPVKLTGQPDNHYTMLLCGFKTDTVGLLIAPRRSAKAEEQANVFLRQAVETKQGPVWDAINRVVKANGFLTVEPAHAG